MENIAWMGTQYETTNGAHIVETKRHAVVEGRPLCGAKSTKYPLDVRFGEGCCEKCSKIIRKSDETHREY